MRQSTERTSARSGKQTRSNFVAEKGHAFGKLRLTKLDCARRQIETAIVLFFEDKDYVSTHTLTAAAYEILRGLNFKAKGAPMMRDSDIVHPDLRKKWKKAHSEAENFFKHAIEDPNDIFHLDPTFTFMMLTECVQKYFELSNGSHELMRMFLLFAGLKLPQMFQKEFIDKIGEFIPVQYRNGRVTKHQFTETLIKTGMIKRLTAGPVATHGKPPSGESSM